MGMHTQLGTQFLFTLLAKHHGTAEGLGIWQNKPGGCFYEKPGE